MNVLWVVDHLGYNGSMHGAGKYYLNTIPLLEKSKFNVTLCVLRRRDNLTEHFEERGIRIHHLGRGKLDPLTLFDLIKLIRKESTNLIHAHGYGSSNFGRLVGAICGIPTIVHAHDEDSNYPWYQALADSFLSRFNHRVIAISKAVRKSCIKKRKTPEDHVLVMYNGIPLEEFKMPEPEEVEKQKRRLGIYPDLRIVGTVAKLREEKGIEYLLKSAPKVLAVLPNTLFVIVGDGPLRKQLEVLSRQLQIDQNVIFLGYRHNVSNILPVFDMKVLPSLTEGFGLAMVEAMAMGKPIVATNVGGIQEILKDGETALLVPPKDPEALAEKIIYLLKSKDRARRLGMKAKEESRKYDIHLYVKKLEQEYIRLAYPKQ